MQQNQHSKTSYDTTLCHAFPVNVEHKLSDTFLCILPHVPSSQQFCGSFQVCRLRVDSKFEVAVTQSKHIKYSCRPPSSLLLARKVGSLSVVQQSGLTRCCCMHQTGVLLATSLNSVKVHEFEVRMTSSFSCFTCHICKIQNIPKYVFNIE